MQTCSTQALELIAAYLKALADPLRLQILSLIRDHARPVKDIVEATGASQPTVSKHLGLLRRAGIVVTERHANLAFYRIRDPRLCDLCDLLQETVVNKVSGDQQAMGLQGLAEPGNEEGRRESL